MKLLAVEVGGDSQRSAVMVNAAFTPAGVAAF